MVAILLPLAVLGHNVTVCNGPDFEEYAYCLTTLAQPWESLRMTWDFDVSFVSNDVISLDSIRDWLLGELLEPVRYIVQNLLRVRRAPDNHPMVSITFVQEGTLYKNTDCATWSL